MVDLDGVLLGMGSIFLPYLVLNSNLMLFEGQHRNSLMCVYFKLIYSDIHLNGMRYIIEIDLVIKDILL